MGKFDGILICTDLDGTLYKKDKTVSSENCAAIEYFKREGGYFTFITGRMPYYASGAYNAVKPNVPFGCVNGGALYDGAADKYIWTSDMNGNVAELIQCIDENFSNVGIQVCAFDKTYFSKENDVMVHFRKSTKIPNLVRDYRDVKEPIGKIIFGSNIEDEILEIEKILRAHSKASEFEFVRSERTLFEILPKGVDKGLALTKLAAHLGMSSERTIAIGDYNNDIGMFRAAGVGIAVSNACNDVKEAADFITVSNEESAIAHVIYDLESGKYNL